MAFQKQNKKYENYGHWNLGHNARLKKVFITLELKYDIKQRPCPSELIINYDI